MRHTQILGLRTSRHSLPTELSATTTFLAVVRELISTLKEDLWLRGTFSCLFPYGFFYREEKDLEPLRNRQHGFLHRLREQSVVLPQPVELAIICVVTSVLDCFDCRCCRHVES